MTPLESQAQMELGQTRAPGDSPGTSGDELRIMKASDRPALTGCWAGLMSGTAMGICSRKKRCLPSIRNPLWPRSPHSLHTQLSAQSSKTQTPARTRQDLCPSSCLDPFPLHRPEVALGFSLSFLYSLSLLIHLQTLGVKPAALLPSLSCVTFPTPSPRIPLSSQQSVHSEARVAFSKRPSGCSPVPSCPPTFHSREATFYCTTGSQPS